MAKRKRQQDIKIIKKHLNSDKTRQLISYLYKKYLNIFYVNAKRKLESQSGV